MSERREQRARVSRTGEGLTSGNVLTPPYEVRRVVWAIGKEARQKNAEFPILDALEIARMTPAQRRALPHSLPALNTERTPALDLIQTSPGTYLYNAHAQGVTYALEIITRKDQFEAALRSPGTITVYSGHARFGRGPCFGKPSSDEQDGEPGEDWEDGIVGQTSTTGIFRMGFPYLAVDVEDIFHHEYTADLVPASEALPREDCHPELRAALGRMSRRTLEQIEAAAPVGEHPRTRTLRQSVREPRDEPYWTFRQGNTVNVVIRAGWQHTRAAPYDLGAIEPTTRVFCHFGCSTYIHNYPVMRRLKEWKREGNERYCYWTTAPSYGFESTLWFYYLLAYDQPSAYRSWEPLLQHCVRKTNQGLSGVGAGYQII